MQNEECKMQKENPNLISWDGESVMSKEFALATVDRMNSFIRRVYYHSLKPEDKFYLPLIAGVVDYNGWKDTLEGLGEYIEAEEERQKEALAENGKRIKAYYKDLEEGVDRMRKDNDDLFESYDSFMEECRKYERISSIVILLLGIIAIVGWAL